MDHELKVSLVSRLKQVGAYDVRIANPQNGFEHALPGQHPLQLWPACKSVVVFAVAMSPKMNNTYMGPRAPGEKDRGIGPVPQDVQSCDHAMDRVSRLFVASITLKGMTFLDKHGYRVSFATPQAKLSAALAGIGVYGRSGLIIHPQLGNRMSLGTILTNAKLESDAALEDFTPCAECDLCVRKCPAQAYDRAKEYPHSWSRSKCTSTRELLARKVVYCHNCFAVCPAGRLPDEDLLGMAEVTGFHEHKGQEDPDRGQG